MNQAGLGPASVFDVAFKIYGGLLTKETVRTKSQFLAPVGRNCRNKMSLSLSLSAE
jgi:hypothetical protein